MRSLSIREINELWANLDLHDDTWNYFSVLDKIDSIIFWEYEDKNSRGRSTRTRL